MFSQIGIPELLIVLFIVLLLFGTKRLPALGRQLGGGLREFKDAITRDRDGDHGADGDDEAPAGDRPALSNGAQPQPAASDDPTAAEVVADRRP